MGGRAGGGERALLLMGLAGCAALDAPTLTVSRDVRTVASATWTDDGEEESFIEVSLDGESFLRTDTQAPAESHSATLLGLWPGLSFTARVETASGAASVEVPFVTGAPPVDFPDWDTTGEAQFGGVLTTALMGVQSWAVVVDDDGRLVWYQDAPTPSLVLRARLRRDGAGVVYARTHDSDEGGIPSLVWANWDGSVARELELPDYTHDFVELADGTLVAIRNDIREVEGYDQPVWGNSVVELGVDDSVRVIWTTWDDWTPGVDGSVQENGYWTHANALDVSDDEAVITLGMRDLSQIIRIDRATGEQLWQLGGEASDYRYAQAVDAFHEQHQFEWVDDELLVFDNRESDAGSRVMQYAFEEPQSDSAEGSLGLATAVWSWQHPSALWSYVLGDVSRLEDGGTLATFSTAGVISDVSPEGEVRWELETNFRAILGFVERSGPLPGVARVR